MERYSDIHKATIAGIAGNIFTNYQVYCGFSE